MAIRPGKYPQLTDEAWLRDQYEKQGKSTPEIAAEIGCTAGNVQLRLKQFGIQARGRHYGRWNPKACNQCGEIYTPSGPFQRFCSNKCRYGTRKCEECGKEFVLVPDQKRKGVTYTRKFCSEECRKAWWSRTSRHRYVDGQGYVEIVPPTMSRRVDGTGYVELSVGALGPDGKTAPNGGRVKEHRWVMEQRLGRKLYLHEEVHHKNGHKDQNDRFCLACAGELERPYRPGADDLLRCAECGHAFKANLELWSVSQPRGQRVEDKIAWAIEFLHEYGYQVTETIT